MLIYPLRGNHESFVIEDLVDKDELVFYPDGKSLIWGDLKYPKLTYRSFFDNLPYYYRIDDVVMVHAGLNLDSKNPFLDYDSMMWIWDFYPQEGLGFKVIHGHSNIFLQLIESSVKNGEEVINLDNGCYKKGQWNKGNLVCYDLSLGELFIQENIEI